MENADGELGTPLPRPPRSKRGRLSLACTQCRKRKVRCDATTPKCRNCVLRGDSCETFDPRRPNGPAVRRWPGKDGPSGGTRSTPRHRSLSHHSSPHSVPSTQLEPSVALSQSVPKERHPSWIERAYHQSQATPDGGDGQTNDSPDVVMNTDDTSHRFKYMGPSSLQCLVRFIDLCFESKGLGPIGSHFRWGMSFSEEYALPLLLSLPNLPEMSAMEPCINTFFGRTHSMIPVLDRQSFISDVLRFSELQEAHEGGLQCAITSTDVPALVAMYSVLTIGIDDGDDVAPSLAAAYLDAAYSLVSHLISFPYIGSVQALLLLVIALRGRGKEGQSWHLLGQATRIAHSLGLHRQVWASSPDHSSPAQPTRALHSRLWWVCYSLDKLMELETGRPSAMAEFDCDQPLPDGKTSDLSPYFMRWVSLSQIVSQISENVYRRKASSSLGLLSEIARLDQALLDWLDNSSEESRQRRKSISDGGCTGAEPLFEHFLSVQYYQAQITLLRASLIFPEASFAIEIKKRETQLKNPSRLLQYQNICVEGARSIITQTAEFADRGLHFILLTATPPLLAAVTLALHTLKKPHKRMGRSDGELVRTATDYVADFFQRIGQHEEFIRGILELAKRMNHVLSGEGSLEQGSRTSTGEVQDVITVQSTMSPSQFYAPEMDSMSFDPSEHFQDPFEDMPLDQFWAIMEGGFTSIGGDHGFV
ncbi:hypothetical protein ACJZ2D_011248 [Fusarium nematophilum]